MHELIGHDLYIYRHYPNEPGRKDGPIECFRVWDSERFIDSQIAAGESKALHATERFLIYPATREQYIAQRKASR